VRLFLALFMLLSLVACSSAPPEPSAPQSLVDHSLWVDVGAADDPFEDRPEEFECSELSHGYDSIGGEDSLEVDTAGCDYLTVSQPSLASVLPGDQINLRLWHYSLDGPDGESHIAVTVGGELIWDLRLPIPGESELVSDSFGSELSAPEGSEVLFHLHNHGSNTYNFIELSVAGS